MTTSHSPRRGGQVSSMVTAAVPTLVFAGADGTGGLGPALIAAMVSGVLILGWQLRARRQIRHAVFGAVRAMVCAAVAAGTGQARNFFVLPMLVPAAAAVGCVLSVLVGSPLAGLVANRIVGGPADWRSHQPLRRFYLRTTLLIALASCASLAAQVAMYRLDAVALLAIAHILMAPLWAGITAVSIAASRVVVTRQRNTATAVG
jgi:Protein of unknown function (DUF3159)